MGAHVEGKDVFGGYAKVVRVAVAKWHLLDAKSGLGRLSLEGKPQILSKDFQES